MNLVSPVSMMVISLFASLIFSVVLFFKLKFLTQQYEFRFQAKDNEIDKFKAEILKVKADAADAKLKRSESVELKEFIADLASGGGMLAVKRMDPNDIFMRSPKIRNEEI